MGKAVELIFNGKRYFARELTAREIDMVLGGRPRMMGNQADELLHRQPGQDGTGGVSFIPDDLTTLLQDTADAPGPDTPDPREEYVGAVTPTPPGGFHIFDLIFHDQPVNSFAASLSTGISLDELNGDVSPVELETVLEAVKAANPFLLKAVENGRRMAEETMKSLESMLKKLLDGQQTT